MTKQPMKGITCCADCAYYSMKKHKCVRCTDSGKPTDHFYADCPLPDVVTKESKDGWISVKDKMPEYDKEVLIYAVSKTTNEPKVAISYLMDKFYFGSRPINLEEPIWHEPWQYFRANNTITHWMPLPEPPKEET